MKMNKLLETLIETQKQINKSLKDLREDLKPKIENARITVDKIYGMTGTMNDLQAQLETNVYTKEQTIDAVNREYDYRKDYEQCKSKNYVLLQLIEKYCKYNDKYEIIKIFSEINTKYEIKKRKEKE